MSSSGFWGCGIDQIKRMGGGGKKRVEQFVTVLSVNSVINVRFVELIGLNAAGYGWRESLGLTGVRRKHQSLKTRHPSITPPYD